MTPTSPAHEAWEQTGTWCTCCDCGHGWSQPVVTSRPVDDMARDVLDTQCPGCSTCQERAKAVAAAFFEAERTIAGLVRRIHAATPYLTAIQAAPYVQGKDVARWSEAAMQALTSATAPTSGGTS